MGCYTVVSMDSISITLFPPRVARSRMVKTTLRYGLSTMEMGPLFSSNQHLARLSFPSPSCRWSYRCHSRFHYHYHF
ncbi:hypothetical protein PVK06_017243 [Gossypium arboreum]|uniref:Uncharacterized protein n=1 Tax=Gossypium arboreum TaxID=29729 RepID=A0ABR0Q343_GOSAR|nr:hypothetical protein PVK06_017243 [Gossypium arboreum]